jgi:hypothetical protein
VTSFWRFGYAFYTILERNIDISNIEGTLFEYIKALFELTLNNISFGLGVFLLLLIAV